MGLKAVVMVAGMVLVAGCDSQPPPTSGQQQGAGARAQQDELFSQESGLARAVSSDRSGAAVGLSYDLQGRPAAGVAVPLVLVFQVGAQVQALQAVITGMEGLNLQGELQAGFEPVSPGQPYRHELSVTPERTGVFYLTVRVSALNAGGDQPQERSFSIPFVVGEAPEASPSAAPGGEGDVPAVAAPAAAQAGAAS